MNWRSMDRKDRGMVLLAGALLVIMICSIVAQMPPPTDANSLGAPDRNIENENCYCHTNALSGKEPSEKVNILIDPASTDKMVTNGNATIKVTIQYADSEGKTRYGYAVDLDSEDGKSLDGAALKEPNGTPSENQTHLAQSQAVEENVFNITLTAPKKPQSIRFTFVGNAVDRDGTEKGDHWNYVSKVIEVFKKRDVAINATVRNNGVVEAKEINLTLLVDGELVGMQHIPVVPPEAEENITFYWDATFYDAGEYKVEVVIDSNHTNLEFNEDNNRLTKTIILEPLGGADEGEYDWQTIMYYILGAIIILITIGVLYRRFA